MKKALVKVFDLKAREVGQIPLRLDEPLKGTNLFLQYLRVFSSRARRGQAQAKGRGEVSGGGRKPWRQKGTGRARQGSIRSPLWRGGGVSHGPRARDYRLAFNKKSLRRVWSDVLFSKFEPSPSGRETSLFVLDTEKEKAALKTKEASVFLEKVAGGYSSALVVSSNVGLRRAFRNLVGVRVSNLGNLSPYQLTAAQVLVFTKEDFLRFLEKFPATGRDKEKHED